MKNILSVFFLGMMMSFGANAQNFASADNVVKIKTSAICKMCKKRIERDLSLTKGVEKAELNLEDKVVTVAFNHQKTNAKDIKKAISNIGYDADEVVADQKSHDRLPDCCQKTAVEHKD
jgi:periplasmic mercuric ion binding protein